MQTRARHRLPPSRIHLAPALLAALALTAAACSAPSTPNIPADWPFPLDGPAVGVEHGAVVSTDAYASNVGAAVLRAGGNAVDAAVATSFALAVVNPEAGNIGGGGFMVVHLADGTAAALDYREKAPLGASRDMYLDDEGNLTEASTLGHRAAGVPGTVAGLWRAHERFGVLAWAELVQPAVELARGFEIRERQARSLAMAEEDLRLYPTTEATFLPGGVPPAVGDTFRQPELAATLERIRDQGRDGFYTGRTADLIVAEMRRGDGLITHEDLASYDAAWRDPIVFGYRGHTVISMAPTSSGGATMAEIANILEGYDVGSLAYHSPEHVHLLAEAYRRAYADRNAYLADPDFVPMPLDRMISDAYAAERRSTIDPEHATPSADVGPGLGTPAHETNTTHFSIVDGDGNAVAVTTTINSFYGCKVTVAGAGFLLNNEMDDFAAQPGHPNQFGLVQGENNAIQPGKRMLSAMTPSIVLRPDGRLRMVTGTPGGATIITTVFQTISNVIDFGMGVRGALNAPRVHHQHLPDRIDYEPGGLPADVVSALEAMGHTMRERNRTGAVYPYTGDVQAILVGEDGRIEAWSDPRRGGSVAGY